MVIGFVLPLLIFLLIKLGGCNLTLLHCYSIYGYSYFLILIGIFGCLIPNDIGATAAISLAFLCNIIFLIVNMRT